MDIGLIKQTLPHKYPFLLVDRVLDIDEFKRAVAIKNITINEPFFQGHYPDAPVMPEVLIIEALSQTGALIFLNHADYIGRLTLFESVKSMSFMRPVIPGDQLRMEVEVTAVRDTRIDFFGRALVDGKTVCEGAFSFSLSHKPSRPHIHPTSSVHPSAILGKDVSIGPFCIVGENVVIGDRTKLEAHVMLEKWTKVGEDCHIHYGSVIGSKAQDFKYEGETAWVVIGDRCTIREYVTINRSTGKDTQTKIGSDTTILTNVHIGHNCEIGNNVIITNMSNLAGHTIVHDNVIIGGMTGVHQFCRIGQGAMVAAYTRLAQDVPPFTLVEGNPAVVRNLNVVGLKRRGVNRDGIKELRDLFRLMFTSHKNTSQALSEISGKSFTTREAQVFLSFIQGDSHRGIIKRLADSDTESD